jgi:hypothetical protein
VATEKTNIDLQHRESPVYSTENLSSFAASKKRTFFNGDELIERTGSTDWSWDSAYSLQYLRGLPIFKNNSMNGTFYVPISTQEG